MVKFPAKIFTYNYGINPHLKGSYTVEASAVMIHTELWVIPIQSSYDWAVMALYDSDFIIDLQAHTVTFTTRVCLAVQVGIVDLDICGPSVPKLLGVQGQSVISSQYGWVPIR